MTARWGDAQDLGDREERGGNLTLLERKIVVEIRCCGTGISGLGQACAAQAPRISKGRAVGEPEGSPGGEQCGARPRVLLRGEDVLHVPFARGGQGRSETVDAREGAPVGDGSGRAHRRQAGESLLDDVLGNGEVQPVRPSPRALTARMGVS